METFDDLIMRRRKWFRCQLVPHQQIIDTRFNFDTEMRNIAYLQWEDWQVTI
jgi:hypothetical protein